MSEHSVNDQSPNHTRRGVVAVGAMGVATLATAGAICLGLSGNHAGNAPGTGNGQINLLAGEWQYLPGATVTKDGLHMQHRGFTIVEQDGSGGQANPPVNVYGTYLHASGSFAVEAALNDIHGPASLRLYATPPMVSDEFRVETPSVGVTVSEHTVTVQEWDGRATGDLADQQPVLTQSFPVETVDGGDADIALTDTGGQIAVRANNVSLGMVADHDIFHDGTIYFGADAQTDNGSFTISKLTASGDGAQAIDAAAAKPYAADPTGLQQLAAKVRPGFVIGSDAAEWAAANPAYDRAIFGGNFGIITPENAMKWEFTEPQPGVYDFQEADALVNEALKNGMQVHGHNLVFSEALPKWLQELPTDTPEQKAYVQKILYNHVYALVSHFKGRVHEWDLNELFADYDDNGNLPNGGFTDNVFYRALGEDYVRVVTQAATAADPDTKLWINDFGAETDTDARWQFIYSTVAKWKQVWGLPLYGFGFESHNYDPSTDSIVDDSGNTSTFTQHINAFAGIGMESRVSEADAPASDPGYGSSSQAKQLSGLLRGCITNPHCVAFSIWSTGITDLWQDDNHALQTGSVDSPFNPDMKPNATYTAMQQVLTKP